MSNVTGQVVLTPGVIAEVPSASKPGEKHQVRLSKNGNVYCDCEGYAYRGLCSHIETAMGQIPLLKALVRASLRERIAHFQNALAKLEE